MVLADSAVGVWKRTIMSGRKETEIICGRHSTIRYTDRCPALQTSSTGLYIAALSYLRPLHYLSFRCSGKLYVLSIHSRAVMRMRSLSNVLQLST